MGGGGTFSSADRYELARLRDIARLIFRLPSPHAKSLISEGLAQASRELTPLHFNMALYDAYEYSTAFG